MISQLSTSVKWQCVCDPWIMLIHLLGFGRIII